MGAGGQEEAKLGETCKLEGRIFCLPSSEGRSVPGPAGLTDELRAPFSPPPAAITFLPAQDTQHQVEDEEGAQQNEGDEIDPGPLIPDGIVDLVQTKV